MHANKRAQSRASIEHEEPEKSSPPDAGPIEQYHNCKEEMFKRDDQRTTQLLDQHKRAMEKKLHIAICTRTRPNKCAEGHPKFLYYHCANHCFLVFGHLKKRNYSARGDIPSVGWNSRRRYVWHEVLKEYHRRGLGGLELGGGLTPPRDGVAEHCSPLFPWQLMAFHGFLGIFWVYKL